MKRILVLAMVLLGSVSPASAVTKFSTSIVPTPGDCTAAGSVCLNTGVACGDPFGNSDCIAAAMSSKSKMTLDSTLRLKATLRGVVTNVGTPATTSAEGGSDNYILQVEVQSCFVDAGQIPYCNAPNDIYLKVAITAGSGKLSVDLSSVMAPFGMPYAITRVALLSPRGLGNCNGINSTVDITARVNDSSCNDGIGVVGVGGIGL